MSTIREQLILTAKNYIDGFNAGTPEGYIASRTPNCIHALRPATLPPPLAGTPRTNEEYQAFIIQGSEILRNIRLDFVEGEDMVVDEVARKVVLHLKSTGESDTGPYTNEYFIVLKMMDDGNLIKEIVEFIDSAYMLSLAAKMVPKA